ncbi:hypothetical protein NXZ84_00415 [Mechercharimyces sp. CAU 1602]|nr:hypothetical protein [Mechercharimyces sp. CAU 1602]
MKASVGQGRVHLFLAQVRPTPYIYSDKGVFNHFLAKWNEAYKITEKGLSYPACSRQLTQLKKE